MYVSSYVAETAVSPIRKTFERGTVLDGPHSSRGPPEQGVPPSLHILQLLPQPLQLLLEVAPIEGESSELVIARLLVLSMIDVMNALGPY